MVEHFARAQKYRDRAKEFRRLAATLEESEPRSILEKLADEYEAMALSSLAKSTASPATPSG